MKVRYPKKWLVFVGENLNMDKGSLFSGKHHLFLDESRHMGPLLSICVNLRPRETGFNTVKHNVIQSQQPFLAIQRYEHVICENPLNPSRGAALVGDEVWFFSFIVATWLVVTNGT